MQQKQLVLRFRATQLLALSAFVQRGAPNALAEDVQQFDYSLATTGNPGDAAKTCRSLGEGSDG